MSFSRAPVKRFNEESNEAPPPGHYKVPDIEKKRGVLKFEHGTERFKSTEDLSSNKPSSSDSNIVSKAPSVPKSSKKKLEFSRSRDKSKVQGNVESEINQYKKSLIKLTEQIKADKIKIDHLASDLQESKYRITSLQEANLRLEETQKEMETHSDDVGEQTSRLQKIADQLRAQNSRLEIQLTNNRNNHQLLEDKILCEVRNVASDSVQHSLSVTNTVEGSISSCCDRIEQASLKTESLQNIIPKLKCQNDSLNKEKDELKNELLTLRKEMNILYQENGDSKLERSNALEKCSKLEERIQNLLINSESLEKSRDDLLQKIEDANSRSEAIAQENQILREKESLINAENILLKSEKSTLDSTTQNTEKELIELRAEISKKERELSDVNTKLQSSENELLALCQEKKQLNKQFECLKEELMHSDTKYDTMETQLQHISSSAKELEFKEMKSKVLIKSLEETIQQQDIENKAKLDEFTRRLLETQRKLNQREDELKLKNRELLESNASREATEEKMKLAVNKNNNVLKALEKEKKKMEWELSNLKAKVESLTQAINDNDAENEMKMWKMKYEELEEKVKPFMEQLNGFAAEKELMLSKTSAAEQEATKLGKKYAELLGHQNQRQKIRHVVKLKDDNFALKQENLKLKNQVSSLQKQVIKNRKPRFDPSQAFQSITTDNTENLSPNV